MKNGRILLLVTSHTYGVNSFMVAATRLGVEAVQATNMATELAGYWQMPLGLDFQQVATSVEKIKIYAQQNPLNGILAVDDSGALLAAAASEALGLPHNAPGVAEAARDKYIMRQQLTIAGVPCPSYQHFTTDDDPYIVATQVSYPCVVKPLRLSGSRGVMRANMPTELITAIKRLTDLLYSLSSTKPQSYLIEDYIPGVEVALEGLLNKGNLQVLALFDKPDPLEGPFFEETIYVTPSRLPPATQTAIATCTVAAAQALGLQTGPVHAELRINEAGPWLIEIAGRSIGGLCSQTLRFGTNISLEELIVRQLCGLGTEDIQLTTEASGVMMIPIPEAGLLKGVTGVAAAEAVPLIEQVEITARLNYPLVPLPEGSSYLGFIFARGETPALVEAALRQAHSCLHFEVTPHIVLSLR